MRKTHPTLDSTKTIARKSCCVQKYKLLLLLKFENIEKHRKMLRKISYRILSTTSDLCRVSPALAKLLAGENNFRAYRGRGIIFEEDEAYDEPGSFDSAASRPKQRSYRKQEPKFGDDYDFEEPRQFNNSSYRPRHSRYSNSGSSYDEFDNSRQSRSYDEFDNRRQNRSFDESNYRNRNTFRNRDSYEQRSFNRPGFGSNFNQSDFGQRLVKPVFDVNNLPPVEKSFYVEHPDVAARSEEDVKSWRKSLSISVRGSEVPRPITNFEELCLPDSLKKVVGAQEYSEPTPIQAQGWPIALSGRDMVGISQTGSGKTLVFVLPAIIHALNQPNSGMRDNSCRPQVLVLAPTRELVQQIVGVSDRFSNSCGLISSCAYGGASKNHQLRFLRGAHICVATPGRLIDFISEGSVNLQQCTYLVLDEADRMLDMGFEPQIRQIIDQIRPDRQTLMWSATWPKEIQNLAEDFLSNYVQVTVGAGELRANPKIEQNIHVVEEGEKEDRLLSLLQGVSSEEEISKVLVFAQTKRKVDYLGSYLHSLGIPVLAIHGDVSQSRRDHVLNRFRREKSCVLIATDVAARGLDITDVQCVVNYDLPTNIDDYIHRIGRTARGDAQGVAHSFFTYENEGMAKDLVAVLKQANQNVPPELDSIVFNLRKNKSRGNSNQSRKFDFRRRQAAFY